MSDISTSPARRPRRRAPETAVPSTRGLASTLVLAVGTFAVGTDAFIVAGFLPSMAGALHVSVATAGQSVTVFAATYAILSPVLATLTARLPRRALLVTALLVLGLGNVASALAPSFAVLIAARATAAAGAAMYTPNAGAVSAALVRPELRGRALAIVIGGLTVATALGVPLGAVASQALGWRSALELVAALCVVAATGVFLIMPALPGNPRVPLRTRVAVLRRPAVLRVLPLTVLGMTAAYTAYAYSVPVLRTLGIPESSIVWMLFLYGLGAVIGNFAAGYAIDRWSTVRVLSVGYVCMTIALGVLGLLAATSVSPAALVGLIIMAWGASSWCQTPPQQHRLIAAAPHEAPLVVSLNSSGIYVGIGLGTTIGSLSLHAGIAAMLGVGAVLALLALVFLRVTAVAAPPKTSRYEE
jgi:DHA1 family inner membrane transport protein